MNNYYNDKYIIQGQNNYWRRPQLPQLLGSPEVRPPCEKDQVLISGEQLPDPAHFAKTGLLFVIGP